MRRIQISMGAAILLLGFAGATYAAPVYWDTTAQNQPDVRSDLLRLTTDVFNPNTLGTVIEGTFDFSEMQTGGVMVLGLVDKNLQDTGGNTYHSGAYAYFHKNTDTTLRWGPWDGGARLNQQIIIDYQDIVPFSLVLKEGLMEMSVLGHNVSDSYGDVKIRNDAGSYPWDEFQYGAYLSADLWAPTPPVSSVSFSITADHLTSPDLAVAFLPEPGTIALLGIGLAGCAAKVFRRRRSA